MKNAETLSPLEIFLLMWMCIAILGAFLYIAPVPALLMLAMSFMLSLTWIIANIIHSA